MSGTPNLAAAQAWLLETYGTWGVPARTEQYGTWLGWQQGILHVDLTAPRVQSLEAKLPAYSAGTDGPVEGEVVAVPTMESAFDVSAWLPLVEGKWLLLLPPEPTCRPPESLARLARPETVESLRALREENETWASRYRDVRRGTGSTPSYAESGALGIIRSSWAEGWGTFRIEDALSGLEIPDIALSCEDYGLVYRLAEHNQNPRLKIEPGRATGRGAAVQRDRRAHRNGTSR